MASQSPVDPDLRSAKVNFSDAAYQYLLKGILSGEFKPGDRLQPQAIAKAVGLSPTPIKHALARLSGEGLVAFIPGLGPHVAAPTAAEVMELYDARAMCETYALREGFDRVDGAFLTELARLLQVYEAAFLAMDGTYEKWREASQADVAIHAHLMSLWPNRKAHSWFAQVNVHTRAFQAVRNPNQPSEEGLREHREIYAALKRRDLPAATEAIRQHAMNARKRFSARARDSGLI